MPKTAKEISNEVKFAYLAGLLNEKFLALAGDMLELAANQFSNHGCNDWRYPADWTENEKLGLALAVACWNSFDGGGDDANQWAGEYGPPDWMVMRFLANYLKNPKRKAD